MHAFDWKEWIASQSSLSWWERRLTKKEVYEELRSPVEYDAKIYTERTSRCASSHPDAKD